MKTVWGTDELGNISGLGLNGALSTTFSVIFVVITPFAIFLELKSRFNDLEMVKNIVNDYGTPSLSVPGDCKSAQKMSRPIQKSNDDDLGSLLDIKIAEIDDFENKFTSKVSEMPTQLYLTRI